MSVFWPKFLLSVFSSVDRTRQLPDYQLGLRNYISEQWHILGYFTVQVWKNSASQLENGLKSE